MTDVSTTQAATVDPADALVALLVPRRQSRVRTLLLLALVVVALGGFALLRSSGVVVPRLRAVLQSSAVGPRGDVSAVVRVFNDGETSTRLDGVGANQPGLFGAKVLTRFPLTIPGGSHRDIAIRWAGHTCVAVTSGEATKFAISARTGLPFSIERGYPVRTSDSFVARIDPAPAPGDLGNESTTSSGFGGWVEQVLRFACDYSR